MHVTIFTDGAARGNLMDREAMDAILQVRDSAGNLHEKELSCGYKKTTNNRMELLGVIRALQALNKPCQVTIYSDSKYVVDAFNQHWVDNWLKKNWVKSDKKPVKNVDLWKTLLEAKAPHQVQFVWVKGHDGHPENERCDQLATSAADQPEAYLLDDVPLIAADEKQMALPF